MNAIAHIHEIVANLYAEYGLEPIVAAEIECYVVLEDESVERMNHFWGPVEKAFQHEDLGILRIEKERGMHQYEIVTQVMMPEQLVGTLTAIRTIIEKYAVRMGIAVSFAAKPWIDQPSSGIHIHLHLRDATGLNSYHKTEEWTSDTLRWSLGGLLARMAADMPIFFPTIEDEARLNDADHVPKIFGWGVNNRYCALRIPADPDPYNKRIEHRMACANADPALLISAILAGILDGLRERVEPPIQQYGKTSGDSIKAIFLDHNKRVPLSDK